MTFEKKIILKTNKYIIFFIRFIIFLPSTSNALKIFLYLLKFSGFHPYDIIEHHGNIIH